MIDADGTRSLRPWPAERDRPAPLRLRVLLLRPPRQPALRPQRPRRPGAHGRAARRAGAGRGRHGHGRPGVRHRRRRGLRQGLGHPLRPGPGEEPLHRPHASSRRPRRCAARPCGSSSTRCARTSPASGSSSSTTRSSAGTTQQQLTRMLREAGAAEIHLRITSPPVRWPCFYGIDIGDRAELLAAQLDDDRGDPAVRRRRQPRLPHPRPARGGHRRARRRLLHACFTGEYPVEVPVGLGKRVLEEPDRAPAGAARAASLHEG